MTSSPPILPPFAAANTVIIATVAEYAESHPLYEKRRAEYYAAFSRFFSYGIPIYAVASETAQLQAAENSAIAVFKPFLAGFSTLERTGTLKIGSKEVLSLRTLFKVMDLPDSSWVVKFSGRYLLTDDTLLAAVRDAHSDCNFIGRVAIEPSAEGPQLYTFGFAMRWGWLKRFIEVAATGFGNKNIERCMYEFLGENGLLATATLLPRLGMFVNVANSGTYKWV